MCKRCGSDDEHEVCDACSIEEARRNTAYAYCANEIYAGYPCRVEGCPSCGGPEHADKVLAEIDKYMGRPPVTNRGS